ncbi:hypothetical protein GGR57DRAFT_511217 [Xylariaceae sp. FL1272]|nr:hypothetical protein GGR57DRAFT_511217 [Xylariaceae sp. FL1272]
MALFEDLSDSGTSTDQCKILPVRVTGGLASRARAFELHVDEAYSVWVIFIPACVAVLGTLAATTWFVPVWLSDHPGDLQNATVPAQVVFTVVITILQILIPIVVFRVSQF